MKNQALFSSKDKSKKLNYRLLQFLFGALRVNNLFKNYLQNPTLSVALHYGTQKVNLST